MGVFGQLAVESLEENLVCDFAHIHTGLVQHREDALMLLLHQVHYDLIIEVINLTTEDRRIKVTLCQSDRNILQTVHFDKVIKEAVKLIS